jgi:DNA-binding MarR family transcriptional regulator
LPTNKSKNISSEERERQERLAQGFFQLNLMFWAHRHHNKVDDPYDLTEPEFVSLNTLADRGICTVGELQQELDVRPAQMSRIIRALENKADKPMIECTINPADKRRINVTITELGQKAAEEYRRRRLTANMEIIKGLSHDDQIEVMRLVDRFREIMSEQLHPKTSPVE